MHKQAKLKIERFLFCIFFLLYCMGNVLVVVWMLFVLYIYAWVFLIVKYIYWGNHIPSNGLTRPELFQSNNTGTSAAGTSGTLLAELAVDIAADDFPCNAFNWFDVDVTAARAADVGFIGSKGVNPRLAANRGIELFHFSP